MNFTVFTFISAQLFISILVLLIVFLSKNNKFICKFGIYFALTPLLACLLRLIFLFETSFVMIIPSFHILAIIYRLYKSSFLGIPLSNLLIIIWVAGSFTFTLLLIKDILNIKRIPTNQTKLYQHNMYDVLKKVKTKRGYCFDVRIIISDFISTPFIFGYFHPIVYIPDINYSENELYYILDHELTHWYNKDLWIKLIVQIICIIYWWNPVIYLLRDILSHSLEIKCDSFICKDLSVEEKTTYLKTIIHTLEAPPTHSVNRGLITSNFVISKDNDTIKNSIKQRFELVFDYNFGSNKNKLLPIVFSILVFLLTFSVVIQPAYMPTAADYVEENEEVHIIDENTSYIIYENGKYYLYDSEEILLELTPNQLEYLIGSGLKIINQ